MEKGQNTVTKECFAVFFIDFGQQSNSKMLLCKNKSDLEMIINHKKIKDRGS